MLTAVLRDERTGQIVGVLVLKPKTFKSGKAGYYASGKVEVQGQRYQGQAQLVKIEPKGE